MTRVRIIAIKDGLVDVVKVDDVGVVLIETDRHTPLAVAHRFAPDGYLVKHAQEPGFEHMLRDLGLGGFTGATALVPPGRDG